MKSNITLIILFLFILSCNNNDDPIDEIEQESETEIEIRDSIYPGFNMYFLKDNSITAQDLYETDLNLLELESRPFVSQEMIEFYDVSAHVIQLTESIDIPEMVSVSGKPFIVLTDSSRHYFGALWPMFSSGNFEGTIIDVAPRFYPNDIVKISLHRSYSGNDNRMNDTIEKFLSDAEILHRGISCEIDSVVILENDSVNNKCKLRYTYTISNNDEDNLYIFDPLKMGDKVFHYFHIGVYLRSEFEIYQSSSDSKAPDSGIDVLSFLTILESGKSMTRSVEKSGYPFIPRGNFKCNFTFSSPYISPYTVAKSKRNQTDGRVWIGKISAADSIIIR